MANVAIAVFAEKGIIGDKNSIPILINLLTS